MGRARKRTRTPMMILPLLLALLLSAAPAAGVENTYPRTADDPWIKNGRLEERRPQPGHRGSLPYDPHPPVAIAPDLQPWRRWTRIVYAFESPTKDLLTPRPELTEACRRGEFRQRIDLLYRAFTRGERQPPLGVADGFLATNLIDVKRRRDGQTVYFFSRQDTGRCTVWSARRTDLRRWFIGP
jgi:hypothetical protein